LGHFWLKRRTNRASAFFCLARFAQKTGGSSGAPSFVGALMSAMRRDNRPVNPAGKAE